MHRGSYHGMYCSKRTLPERHSYLPFMLLQPFLRYPCNSEVIPLKIRKVSIASDSDLPQLDPFGPSTRLPQVIDDTMIEVRVLRRLSCKRHIRHATDIG